jgi:hypothetical protein
MNLEEYREKREKKESARMSAMPVWLVKWKSDGKYLASDRANEWSIDRRVAFRFPTRTNANAARDAIGATKFYTRLVKLTRKAK